MKMWKEDSNRIRQKRNGEKSTEIRFRNGNCCFRGDRSKEEEGGSGRRLVWMFRNRMKG